MLIWGARHEETDAPCAAIEEMEKNRAAVITETYRRWEQRDPTPLIPPFMSQGKTFEIEFPERKIETMKLTTYLTSPATAKKLWNFTKSISAQRS